ncbi:hypothetical protein EQ62_02710 [Salmonella enterica subsp. enterica]|nr:hypothetical protein [Salmonella enterica]ECC2863424.1 hypothetical protein [Salmonella enterica subsp. enterica]
MVTFNIEISSRGLFQWCYNTLRLTQAFSFRRQHSCPGVFLWSNRQKKALINRAMLFIFYLMREKRSFKDSLIVGWVNI